MKTSLSLWWNIEHVYCFLVYFQKAMAGRSLRLNSTFCVHLDQGLLHIKIRHVSNITKEPLYQKSNLCKHTQ